MRKIYNFIFPIKLVFFALLLLFSIDCILAEILGGDYYEKNIVVLSILIITTLYIVTGFVIWTRNLVLKFNIHRVFPALIAYFTYTLFKISKLDEIPQIIPILNILTVFLFGLFFTSMIMFVEILIKPKSASRKNIYLFLD